MMKRIFTLTLLLLLSLTCLVGCGSSGRSDEPASYAATLYAAKNPYIENATANNELVRLLGLGTYGKFTTSVQDDSYPYTLVIRYMYLNGDTDQTTMDQVMVNAATVLMALIEDCEQVSWSYPGDTGLVESAVGVDYINEVLATDVKAAGQDEAAFTALCDRLYPDQTAPVTEE